MWPSTNRRRSRRRETWLSRTLIRYEKHLFSISDLVLLFDWKRGLVQICFTGLTANCLIGEECDEALVCVCLGLEYVSCANTFPLLLAPIQPTEQHVNHAGYNNTMKIGFSSVVRWKVVKVIVLDLSGVEGNCSLCWIFVSEWGEEKMGHHTENYIKIRTIKTVWKCVSFLFYLWHILILLGPPLLSHAVLQWSRSKDVYSANKLMLHGLKRWAV